MEKFSVVFHPCENLDNYVNNTYSYSPLYTHHFFNENDSCSAIQWVRYDIYYIVDTFELFIKVSGQLYMSKEESEIRKSLYVIYKSIFGSIPDYTLILDEAIFKKLLYMRSICSKNYIPPGRILVEIPLENSSIFQIRYCLFQEDNSPNHNNHNGNDHNKTSTKRNSTDDPDSDVFDKSLYFKNTLDMDHFDEELYDECYMNISYKGNFDNCLIYDIIKLINKSKKDKNKIIRKSNYDRLNFSNQENFNILHRRLEWFYHWFIEGASNIKSDSRWSIFIPLIIFTYESIERDEIQSANPVTKLLTSNKEFKKSITNRFDNIHSESIRSLITQESLGVVSNLVDFKHRHSPVSKKLNNREKQYNVTVLGMVTAYYFFTLNNDRLRISQFMIFPNYNGKGFGLWVLEFIYRFGIMDSNVREITVEDPTSAFLVLRYVVALKLCFESNLVDPNILYQNDKNSLGFFKLFTKETTLPSRDDISSICKESKSYSTKLVEILELASILPYPISNDFFTNKLSNKRQKTNNIDVKLSLFTQSDIYIDYMEKIKNKLKFEELKFNGKSKNGNKHSPNKYLNSFDTLLENTFNQTISGYIRVINKLRKIFPNE